MFSLLRSVDSKLFWFKICAEDCVNRNDYDGLRELHAQWAAICRWEERSWGEQEFLLSLSCEVLPKLRQAQYVPSKILKFS